MKKILGFLVLLLSISACASAQTYTGYAWNEVAPDAATAQTFVYRVYLDQSVNGQLVTNVLCAGTTSPWLCSGVNTAPTGKHTADLTAALPDGSSESIPSVPITFNQGPAIPTNLNPKK